MPRTFRTPSNRHLLSTVAFVVLAAGLAAQTVVPVEREPQHRLALENRFIKVLDVVLPPGYVTLFHQHVRDNVSVRLLTDTSRTDPLGGEGTPQVTPVGRVAFNPASTPYTHRVANLGTTPIRILNVELLGVKAESSEGATDSLSNHTIEFENEHARATRITLAPGALLPAHTHPRGWLEVVVAGPNAGHFQWHAAGTTMSAVKSAGTPIEAVELEPR